MIICKSNNEKMYVDLVAAHKGLLKEKKTLETSLKVLSLVPASNAVSNKSSHEESKSAIDSPSAEKVINIYISF